MNRPLSCRFSFRFSLRTAFLVLIAASTAFGYYVAHQRSAAAIEAWDYAVRNTICENLASLPAGMSLIKSVRLDVSTELQELQLAELQATFGPDTSVAKPRRTATWNSSVALDASQRLDNLTAVVVANELLRHYESGLVERGLQRIVLDSGTCDVTTSAPAAVSVSERPGRYAVVLIDVRVDRRSSRGDVRIRYLGPPTS